MKGFLFDENMPVSVSVTPSLPQVYARELSAGVSDSFLWDHARNHQYAIVTKDADFSNRAMLSSPPPWVVRFCIGNMRRADFNAFVAGVWQQIERLLPEHKLINVYHNRIEAIR